MKILSVTAQKPHSTGSGTYLTEIVNSLSRAGHVQAVVGGIYETDTVNFPDGVTFYPVFFDNNFPIMGMSDVMPYPSQKYSEMTDGDIRLFENKFKPVLERAASELQPDIIFCHHLFLLTSLVRRMFPDIKVYGLSHGSDLRQMRKSPDITKYIRSDIASLDRIYSLNQEQTYMIEELLGIDHSDIRIAGTGYNAEIFNSDSKAASDVLTISYAGKLSKSKGIPELLSAARYLEEDGSFPHFKLLLAGGCQDDAIRELVEHSSAEYLGMLSQSELSMVFQQSDIFVLPSYYEGLPLVLIEAIACGAVTVCTDLPGVRAWVESSIPDSQSLWVSMPEMETIDEPTACAKRTFGLELASVIKEAAKLKAKREASNAPLPDTSFVTWDAVADRIFT